MSTPQRGEPAEAGGPDCGLPFRVPDSRLRRGRPRGVDQSEAALPGQPIRGASSPGSWPLLAPGPRARPNLPPKAPLAPPRPLR